ncbi:hypothetical protein [Micromonospora sp. HM5-17]|jgi:hypothetical protein|uniref:hypothetical protein n=1 Tax=Micromonospora sp. HM5-17 TaxID=2487710 RepID=UPI000F46CA52|nr:hypothetical protein [Micromonospora sp. HM5-17]ROT27197.1 hypothetical protein EF879_23370 [Micromonospora sp. HM5-17]
MTAPTAPVLLCTQRIEIPTMNAEFVPEQDGGPCTERGVAKLTIEHDGDRCGHDGLCLLDPETGEDIEPWTEEQWLCRQHLWEYERAVVASSADAGRGAETLTLL